jgi:hypothetical protein
VVLYDLNSSKGKEGEREESIVLEWVVG